MQCNAPGPTCDLMLPVLYTGTGIMHCTAPNWTKMHLIVLHLSFLHCPVLRCAALHCSVVHCTMMFCTLRNVVNSTALSVYVIPILYSSSLSIRNSHTRATPSLHSVEDTKLSFLCLSVCVRCFCYPPWNLKQCGGSASEWEMPQNKMKQQKYYVFFLVFTFFF